MNRSAEESLLYENVNGRFFFSVIAAQPFCRMFLSSSAFSNEKLRNSDSAVVTVTASDRPLQQPIQPEAEKLRRFASNDDKRQISETGSGFKLKIKVGTIVDGEISLRS